MLNPTLNSWKSKGIGLNPGASLKQIQRLEVQIDFQFPESCKNVYQSVNGFNDWDWTPNMFSFFPIERIKEEYETKGYWKDFIPIFDYMINCYHIGYIKGRVGMFKDFEGGKKVCDNIYELFALIDQDSDLIY
ncbi:MAG: hypothetical protein Roseis2KO_20120 [Roseivirga sp.]